MRISSGARSDIGLVRRENQDSYGCFPEQRLFVVADGIGGRSGGALASALTVAAIARSLSSTQEEDLTPVADQSGLYSVEGRRLMLALHDANDRVMLSGQANPENLGMGSTAAAVVVDDHQGLAVAAHAGDTRIYRIRERSIECLTRDHTLAEEIQRSADRPAKLPPKLQGHNVLTRAIGLDQEIHPDIWMEEVRPSDIFLLASDGLHRRVSEDEAMDTVLQLLPDLDAGCERLIELANERGGQDNITVLLVAIDLPLAA